MNPNTNLCRITELLNRVPAFSVADSPILTGFDHPNNYRTDCFDPDDIVLSFEWEKGGRGYVNILFGEVCRAAFNENYISVKDSYGDECHICIYGLVPIPNN
jgi:hypothetical protein